MYNKLAMIHFTPLDLTQQIFFKREDQNITGSVKDRSFEYMFNQLEPNSTPGIVLSSSGNAAISAAYFGQIKNIPTYSFVYPDTPEHKKNKIRAYGGTLIESPHPLTDSYEYAKKHRFRHMQQGENPQATVGYHQLAEEIMQQIAQHKIDISDIAIFLPVSSGTTMVGLAEGFQELGEVLPQIHIVQSQAIHPMAKHFDPHFKRKARSIVKAIVPPLDPPRRKQVISLVTTVQGSGWIVSDQEVVDADTWLRDNHIQTSFEGALALAGYWKAQAASFPLAKHTMIILTGTRYDETYD